MGMADSGRKTVRTSVMLAEDDYAGLQTLAATSDVSVAWVIRHAIQRFLDQHSGQTDLPLRIPFEDVRKRA
jgi:predicted transcriptional regulator